MKNRILILIILLFTTTAYAQSRVSVEPLDDGVKQSVVSVTSTATALPSTALAGRKSLIIKNLDAVDIVYIGASDITADEASTGGFPLIYRETFQGDIGENTILYGRTSSTNIANIVIFEVR